MLGSSNAIADAVRDRCAALAPFTITLGPARVDPEALMLPVHPAQPVTRLRAAIRAALIDLNRDHHVYEWTDIATADLSTPTTPESSGATPAGPSA